MKKFFAILLALTFVLSLGTVAFAAEGTPSITLPDNGHTYKIYQIFTGDLDADGQLNSIVWGTDGKGTTGTAVDADTLAALVALEGTDAENGDAIKALITGAGTQYTGNGQTIEEAAGYYLIEDVAINPANPDDFISLYVVQLVDQVTVAPKGDKPEVEKKVKDINDSEDSNITDNAWQDSADHDINDVVPFEITATMPNSVDGYDTYKVVFHDTMSKGLTYTTGSSVVKIYKDGNVNNTAATNVVTVDVTPVIADATDTTGAYVGGKTLTWTINDVLALGATANSKIVVDYTATLNGDANIGAAGNPNKVYLEYSNNPNDSGEGTPSTGETPEDVVIVFTYKVVVNKVDEGGAALDGAGFTLYKQNADESWTQIGDEIYPESGSEFTWTGLDDGIYKVVETHTPANYNTIAGQIFEVKASHDVNSPDPKLTSLSGDVVDGEITFTPSLADGSLETNVVNQSGAVLPETGGIGTTIFYVAGSILVLAAGILLITKKRMAAKG